MFNGVQTLSHSFVEPGKIEKVSSRGSKTEPLVSANQYFSQNSIDRSLAFFSSPKY
jgi:hypothetical protein